MKKSLLKLGWYWELTKPTITGLVLVATFIGFYLGSIDLGRGVDWLLLINTLLGSALVSGGVGTLNEYLERDFDARMRRTQSRPLPSGRLTPPEALVFGLLISLFGIFHLAITVNALTSILAMVTLLLYLFVYTPLKRRTTLNTVIGAVPGALPPVGGWVAARGTIDPVVWILFGILFLWQIPHFFSIAWIYRKDYERGEFKMLPVVDPAGTATSTHIVVYCTALLICSLGLYFVGLTGGIYLLGSAVLGILFLSFGIDTALHRTSLQARRLLLASVIYLPALLILIMVDRGLFY